LSFGLQSWLAVPPVWDYMTGRKLEGGVIFDPERSPYLKEPMTMWEGDGRREITFTAPQQMGKTLFWLGGLLWMFEYYPGISLVIYPSDDKAVQANEQKVRPVIENIEKWKRELEKPKSRPKGMYRLGRNLSYFQGAARRINMTSAPVCIADELDDWSEEQEAPSSLKDLRLRTTAFHRSRIGKVCTVKGGPASPIWQEFLSGSNGYWHLRCQHCGDLTLRSCDVHNLQWELDASGNPILETMRLICPVCNGEHSEPERFKMNIEGGYIHEFPDRIADHPSFQVGLLGSSQPLHTWKYIAESQLRAGRTGDYKDQLFFDNSVRGLPWYRRKTNESERTQLERLRAPLDSFKKRYRVIGVDSQDVKFYWVARDFDSAGNSVLASCGTVLSIEELEKIRQATGTNVLMIDYGGHRTKEVAEYAKRAGVLAYKGGGYASIARYKPTAENPNIINANSKTYQAELLYQIYGGAGKWKISASASEEYIDHILAMKPNNKIKAGDAYENWVGNGTDHFFDCEKMVLVGRDIVEQYYKEKAGRETRKAKRVEP